MTHDSVVSNCHGCFADLIIKHGKSSDHCFIPMHTQVVKAIQQGEHRRVPLGTTIWWAHLLLSGRRLLFRTQQRALIR